MNSVSGSSDLKRLMGEYDNNNNNNNNNDNNVGKRNFDFLPLF